MSTTESPGPAVDTSLAPIVQKYIELRDRKAALKKAYDLSVESIDIGLEKCERYFLTQMNKMGLESLPTEFGVPYKSNQTSATVADPELFRNWVIEKQEWSALDLKANKTFVAAFKEENQDLPPGINWREQIIVNVRRK